MTEKCWTEGGDRGVNNSSAGPEPTNKELLRKHKNRSNQIGRLCKQKTESIDYFVSNCSILTSIEYIEMHNKVGHYIHWKVCKYFGILDCEKWYEHQLEPITEGKRALGLC